YTHPNTVANANPNDFMKNQQLVLDNEALFMPNGTWVIDEMAEAPRADGFEWGMTAIPAFDDDDGDEGDRYTFTFFEQIWIPKEAENKEAAKEFITYMYSDEAAETFLEAGAVQPIDGIVDKLDEENKCTTASMKKMMSCQPWAPLLRRIRFLGRISVMNYTPQSIVRWKAKFLMKNGNRTLRK